MIVAQRDLAIQRDICRTLRRPRCSLPNHPFLVGACSSQSTCSDTASATTSPSTGRSRSSTALWPTQCVRSVSTGPVGRLNRAAIAELAILPVDTPEPTVVGALASCLDRILRQENRHLLPQAKVRLRMAVHEGLVHLDSANGYAGDAVNTVCRLRDAGCLKQALAVFQDAALALIVSEPIYREVVARRYDGIRDNRFRRIFIDDEEKQFRSEAWMCVVDEDVTAVDLQVTPQPGLLGPDSTTTPPPPQCPSRQQENTASVRSTALERWRWETTAARSMTLGQVATDDGDRG